MSDTTVKITTDLRDDLKLLKGHLRKNNMTDTIRQIMWHAGFREDWFEMIEKKQNMRTTD